MYILCNIIYTSYMYVHVCMHVCTQDMMVHLLVMKATFDRASELKRDIAAPLLKVNGIHNRLLCTISLYYGHCAFTLHNTCIYMYV